MSETIVPNWEDAPEWANYLAMDGNGYWWWYETKPIVGRRVWLKTDGAIEIAKEDSWRDSLQERP